MKGKRQPKKADPSAPFSPDDPAVRASIERSMKLAQLALEEHSFPTFGSLAEAEAYTGKTGDAYYEICCHLE